MLSFHHVPDGRAAIDNLSQHLLEQLQAGKKVIWLIGGGSNIPLSVEAVRVIPPDLQPSLTIALTDERYGDFDHPDSNVRQLREAGFDAGSAKLVPVLRKDSTSLEATVEAYEAALQLALSQADYVVAQLGIGADGHICGILPHSPAVTATTLVSGYEAGQFTRITITPSAIHHIHYGFATAFGESKTTALQQLQQQDLPIEEQPAQILKELPEAHLYSDQVAEQADISKEETV